MAGSGRPPPRPPRPVRRRYPLSAYLPFALMVAIPVALIALAVVLVTHAVAPSTAPSRPIASPTPHSVIRAAGTPHPIVRSAGTLPAAARRPTATPTSRAALPVTIALGVGANGQPLGPATIFHGRHIQLWAFATLPRVRPSDTVRVAWRDLTRHSIVADWFAPRVRSTVAPFAVRMFAYVGDTPSKPFPPGTYRVDVYRNATLVASGAFTVAGSR